MVERAGNSGAVGPHIVVVDDEVDIVEGVREVLLGGYPGARVTGCHSPLIALDWLRREPVNLLWTDYRMPEMDGLALAAEARRVQPGLPVIVFTAADNVRSLAQTGSFPVLPKTVGAAAILDRVRDALEPMRAAPLLREREPREPKHGIRE